jgi:2-methylisocitrate lyase-like PEP mutase family enzyme
MPGIRRRPGPCRQAGFKAIATSSGAIATALGYPDGEVIPVSEMLDIVASIVAAVSLPVTADLERGYGLPPAELVERIAATGAVGCNLEDTDARAGAVVEASQQADFLAAVRAASVHSGYDLVVNARIDVRRRGPDTLDDAIARARLYREAGADCVFPLFFHEPAQISALVDAGGVVSIMYRPKSPGLAELAQLGVARVSFGGGLHQAVRRYHTELLDRIAAGAEPF